jgi:hypothetical protein
LQGGHHEAKKFSTTTWPFSEARSKLLDDSVVPVEAGAGVERSGL